MPTAIALPPLTNTTAPAAAAIDDPFDLDVKRIVEAGPEVLPTACSTNDGCAASCASSCTSAA